MEVFDTISTVVEHKSHDLWSIDPDGLVYDAIKLMAEKNVGSLLVMSGDSLVGMFTEREYTREVFLKGRSSKKTSVREVMATEVHTISPHDSAVHGLRVMTRKKVRHLPVVEKGKVVGLVSIGDLVNWIINAQDALIHQLQDYITKGGYPE